MSSFAIRLCSSAHRPRDLYLFLLGVGVVAMCSVAQPAGVRSAADSVFLRILEVPDSARSLAPLDFRVEYNTAGRDLCLNVTVSAYPQDTQQRNFGAWVNGAGTLSYHHRVPNHRRASAFYITAYLTNDGRWSGREMLASTYDRRSRIIPDSIRMFWDISVPPAAAADSEFITVVGYARSERRPMSIPYLVTELVDPDGRTIARQLEWSVPDSARFRQRWLLPADRNAATLRLRATLEDESFDPAAAPLDEAESQPFVLRGARTASFAPVEFRRDTLLLNGNPAFLHGVNIFSFWNAWDDSTIRREFGKMRRAGFTFARVYLDWSLYQPRRNEYSEPYKRKIAVLLRAADSLGMWIEPVPVGNWGSWIYDMYRDHWWTSDSVRQANTAYFESFGRWLDSLDARNILYVSVMQEGSWYFDWFDPFTGREYPGPGALAEADADWRAWLAARNQQYRTFDEADPELFGRWAGERFTDLLSLRASAFRKGSNDRYAVGAEGTGGGVQYDRRVLGKHVTYYSLPELWAHVVDCFEVHNYAPIDGAGYWSGSTGLETYMRWASAFRLPVMAGEIQWNYAGTATLDMDADSTWARLREKLEVVRRSGYIGYAIWAWMDYDQRKLGFLDRQFRPRPILDSLSRWIRGQESAADLPPFGSGMALGPNYPSPALGRTTFPFRVDAESDLTLFIQDLLGRTVAVLPRGAVATGAHTIEIDLGGLSAGIYRCILRAPAASVSRLFVVNRR
jgi:hypothetical protein